MAIYDPSKDVCHVVRLTSDYVLQLLVRVMCDGTSNK